MVRVMVVQEAAVLAIPDTIAMIAVSIEHLVVQQHVDNHAYQRQWEVAVSCSPCSVELLSYAAL